VSPHNYDGNDESEAERFSRLSPQSSAGLVAGSGAGAYRVVRRGGDGSQSAAAKLWDGPFDAASC
jgi:hypothetical protein